MEFFKTLLKGDLSGQAHLIVGPPGGLLPALVDCLKIEKGILADDPDLFVREFDAFGISESRLIKRLQQTKSIADREKFFLLGVHFITVPAQNALLKTLEEPATNVRFFIIANNLEIFLPTVRSRCRVHTPIGNHDLFDRAGAEEFLKSTPLKRFNLIEKWLKEKDKSVLKKNILQFLSDLEVVLTGLPKEINSADLSLIISSRRQIYAPGVLPKMILENLALNLSSGKGN